jgi:hypothetical protein
MKKKLMVTVVVVVAVVLVAFYLRTPGRVPAGQQPLVTLSSSNVGQFESAFDDRADIPRLVLMFSPT